jgi:hypothetical protein
VLILLVASVSLPAQVKVWAVTNEGYYHREFIWDYGGSHWTWSLDIPKSLYSTYQSVPVSVRVQYGPGGYGFLATTKDSYVIELANELREGAANAGYGAYDEVSYILAFVQSLPYTSDSVSTEYDEYPRFPIETLVDGGGDCEDTSILFATITLILNYGTIFISPPGHFAVGVLGNNLYGSYYTFNDKTYYYCETTSDGWKIGQIPDEYNGVSAHLYALNENAQYVSGQTLFDTEEVLKVILVGGAFLVAISAVVYKFARRHRTKEVPPPQTEQKDKSDSASLAREKQQIQFKLSIHKPLVISN